MVNKGDRVGVIGWEDDDAFYLFGYGVYDGDLVPSEEEAATHPALAMFRVAGVSNPHITLDNGKVVWGLECWWGAEDVIRKKVGNKKVVEVDIEECRRDK